MWDKVSQIAIVLLGAGAIILIAKKNKWGFVVGLISQPFWFVTAIANEQMGVFIVSIIYTVSWIFGIFEWFWKKPDKK